MFMTEKIKIRKVGNSLGLILSQPILKSLNLEEGDELFIVKTPEGIMITPFDPEFAEAMQVYKEGSKAYRNAMRELAKWRNAHPLIASDTWDTLA